MAEGISRLRTLNYFNQGCVLYRALPLEMGLWQQKLAWLPAMQRWCDHCRLARFASPWVAYCRFLMGYFIDFIICRAPGASTTTNMAGNIKNTIGKSIFTGRVAARSLAR